MTIASLIASLVNAADLISFQRMFIEEDAICMQFADGSLTITVVDEGDDRVLIVTSYCGEAGEAESLDQSTLTTADPGRIILDAQRMLFDLGVI